MMKSMFKVYFLTHPVNDCPIIFFPQVLMWINQNFLLNEDIICTGELNIGFMSLRGSGPVFLNMQTNGQVLSAAVYHSQTCQLS